MCMSPYNIGCKETKAWHHKPHAEIAMLVSEPSAWTVIIISVARGKDPVTRPWHIYTISC